MNETETCSGVRSRENTRLRLIDAAADVFTDVGLEGASVEAICEHAGFTRGAFYSNFASKDELFLAMIARLAEVKMVEVEDRMRSLDAESERRLPPADLVSRIIGVSTGQEMEPAFLSEIRTQALRNPDTARAYLAWQDGIIERIERMVTELVATYGFRLRLPPRDISRLFLQVVDDTCTRAALEGIDQSEVGPLVNARAEALARALVDPPRADAD